MILNSTFEQYYHKVEANYEQILTFQNFPAKCNINFRLIQNTQVYTFSSEIMGQLSVTALHKIGIKFIFIDKNQTHIFLVHESRNQLHLLQR